MLVLFLVVEIAVWPIVPLSQHVQERDKCNLIPRPSLVPVLGSPAKPGANKGLGMRLNKR